jgi:hypothetical protein
VEVLLLGRQLTALDAEVLRCLDTQNDTVAGDFLDEDRDLAINLDRFANFSTQD